MVPASQPRKPRFGSRIRAVLRMGPVDRLRRRVRGLYLRSVARSHARRHNALQAPDAPVLNFYPMLPSPRAHIGPICTQLGLRIGHSPGAPAATIAWHTGTHLPRRAARRLPPEAINGRCLDVSKSRVASAWEEAAGYPLAVDPLTTSGPLVAKSEIQGRHDGRLVTGPLRARRRGMVYQRFIDARRDDQFVVLRTVIVGPEIAVVFEKGRAAADPFGHAEWSAARRVEEVYSEQEVATLMRFAALMEFDYGELDVLRDASSGLIYVVDANRTPMAARDNREPEGIDGVAVMAASFGRLLEARHRSE
jgi:hypothetical protein